MINFISDLDQTLIYSKRNLVENVPIICVEQIDNKEITYMTEVAYNHFIQLLHVPYFRFIPCTLRDFNQTTRISFIKNYHPEFMICDGGGNVYIDGMKDIQYRKEIEKTIDVPLLEEIKEKIENIIKDGYVKFDNNSFLTCIFKDKETAVQQLNEIKKQCNSTQFYYDLQNRKYYIIPKELNKEVAVKYLMKQYGLTNLITSGDGNVDKDFVTLGNYILLPKHTVFQLKNENRINKEKILNCEGIIEKIMDVTF